MKQVELEISGFSDFTPIARGGSSLVYKAHQSASDRFVAVKYLEAASGEQQLDRFSHEARVMEQLESVPGAMSIYASGKNEAGYQYLVMPFYEVGSLENRIVYKGPLGWQEAVRIAISLGQTLMLSHKAGVYHRDVKPANVLLSDKNEPILSDFGVASSQDLSTSPSEGKIVCTPAYAAPEALLSETSSAVSLDIYGLGATLWASIAGRKPFDVEGSDPQKVAAGIQKTSVGDLRAIVPDEVCKAIEKAMAKRAEDRFSSISLFVKALEQAAGLVETTPYHPVVDPSLVGGHTLIFDQPLVSSQTQAESDQQAAAALEQKNSESSEDDEVVEVLSAPSEGSGRSRKLLFGLSAIFLGVVLSILGVLAFQEYQGRPQPVGDYVAMSVDDAERKIIESGFDPKVKEEWLDGSTVGEVLSQVPAADKKLNKGDVVQIVVSKGPSPRSLPEVEDLSVEEASLLLEEENFVVSDSSSEEYSDDISEGQVIRAEAEGVPEADSYEVGTSVRLVLSLGKEKVTIPRISKDEISSVLEQELGLKPVTFEEFSEEFPAGEIIRMNPEPGGRVDSGSRVEVYISRGSAELEIPNVIGRDLADAISTLESAGFTIDMKGQDPGCRIKISGNKREECRNYEAGRVWRYTPTGKRRVGDKVTLYTNNDAINDYWNSSNGDNDTDDDDDD